MKTTAAVLLFVSLAGPALAQSTAVQPGIGLTMLHQSPIPHTAVPSHMAQQQVIPQTAFPADHTDYTPFEGASVRAYDPRFYRRAKFCSSPATPVPLGTCPLSVRF